jgi:hypothetical protein
MVVHLKICGPDCTMKIPLHDLILNVHLELCGLCLMKTVGT